MKKNENAIRYASNSLKNAFEAHSEMWTFLNQQWSEIFALQQQIDEVTSQLNEHPFRLAAPIAE